MEFTKKNRIIISGIFLSVLGYLNIIQSNMLISIILLLSMLLLVVFKHENFSFALLCFLIPNIKMFIAFNNSMSLTSIFVLLLFGKLIIKKGSIFPNKLVLIFFIYSCIIIINAAIYSSFTLVSSTLKIGLEIFIFYLVCFQISDSNYYETCIDSFIIGTISMIFFGLFNAMINGVQIYSSRFGAVNDDPNYYSLVVSVAVSVALIQFIRKKKISYAIYALALTICGSFSLSRGFIFSMIINSIVFIYEILRRFNYKKIILLAITVLVLILLEENFLLIIENYSRRFSSQALSDNSRFWIWEWYINKTISHPLSLLIGIGPSNVYVNNSQIIQAEHNILVQIFSSIGLLGFFVTVLLWVTLARTMKIKLSFFTFFSFVPFFTLLMGYMFLSGMNSDLFFITIALCIIFERRKKTKNLVKLGNQLPMAMVIE